jgi:antirestriction protein ArdC
MPKQTNPVTETIKTDLYQEVTNKIIAQLEQGTVPWLQPWKSRRRGFSLPKNLTTGNRYRGINILLLWSAAVDQEFTVDGWASFKQWGESKERIRKGEKGTKITYFNFQEVENEQGEIDKVPFIKSSIVFNKDQLENFVEPIDEDIPSEPLFQKDNIVEQFIANTGIDVVHHHKGAYYRPADDKVYMPHPERFIDTDNATAKEGYYSALFHEVTHATGAKHRLDRKKPKRFADKDYAYEELVAELGAAFLCSKFGVTTIEKPNHASYIQNWLTALRDNKTFIFTAASEASKAVDYLENLQPE